MKGIKNTAQVDTYDEPAKLSIKVHSHWNDAGFVVLQFGPDDKDKVTVAGNDLKRAIDNCMNVGR